MRHTKREGTATGKLVSQPIEPPCCEQTDCTLLTWLGMAGALINVRGTILLIDPLITLIEQDGETLCEGGHRLKISLPIEAADVPRADAVMYTHADGDHFVAPYYAEHVTRILRRSGETVYKIGKVAKGSREVVIK